ncbi:hypothetical protein BH10CHL1_BH10CHL1_00600 [soil metagenome]
MRKHLRVVFSLLTVGMLLLAACGGSAEPTAAPAEATATTAPAPADTPTVAAAEAVTETTATTSTTAMTETTAATGTTAMTATTATTETTAPTATDTMTGTGEMTGTQTTTSTTSTSGPAAKATPGKAVKMVLLPKFLGIAVFDQAHDGAEEAAKELQNPEKLEFLGPTAADSVAGQIEIVTNAATQKVGAIMISNNAGDQIVPAAKAAKAAGLKVVTWDSPIPTAEGEDVFIAQVDFKETGKVMADMAVDILGADGGKFAILSASPDAANQNSWIAAMKDALKDAKYSKLELLDTVYGNDQSEDSYKQALALVDKYPDMKLIMAPTSVGIVAAAKALQDENLCDKIKVSGLGLPSEMLAYNKNGCSPEFALWSFVDLGYLTYYTTYMMATGAIEGKEGETYEAGRMGTYTITKDPTREKGLRVLMGPFSIYNKDNIDTAK